MKRISRVVCAVDIDDAANTTFEQALAVARARDARLVLVCAVPPGQPFSRRAPDRVACLLKLRRRAEAAGVDVHVSVQTGPAAEIVSLHAASRRADLVVVGVPHGRADGEAWGAVAEDVARSVPCPTLVVPAGAIGQAAFANVVYAVSDPEGPVDPDAALLLSPAAESMLTVLHVAPRRGTASDRRRRLQSGLATRPERRTTIRVAVGAVAPQIRDAVRATGADLLVIDARPRNRVARRLFGVTRQLLDTAACPVLAIPSRARTGLVDREAA